MILTGNNHKPTDDLVRLWRSRAQQAVKMTKASMSMLGVDMLTLGRRSPSSSLSCYCWQ